MATLSLSLFLGLELFIVNFGDPCSRFHHSGIWVLRIPYHFILWNGHHVFGVLAISRSIGNLEIQIVPIAENIQSNMKVIYYSRTFLSIIRGVIAGISGFTGWMGFIFYFFVMALTSLGIAAKAGFSVHSYFNSWNRIILDGFLGGLMSFVLFWTYPLLYSGRILHGLIVLSSKLHSLIKSISPSWGGSQDTCSLPDRIAQLFSLPLGLCCSL